MLRIKFALAVVGFCSVVSTHQSIAGPLTSAEVTKVINRVSVIDPAKGTHQAVLRDVIKDNLALQTGARSRSELLFQDNTLTRIGAETFFSFQDRHAGLDAGERIDASASAEGTGRSDDSHRSGHCGHHRHDDHDGV